MTPIPVRCALFLMAGLAAARDDAGTALRALDPPALAGAQSLQLWSSADGDELLLSWLEPADGERLRLRLARLVSEESAVRWSAPSTVVEDGSFWPNWADVPSVVRGADGALYAHRLRRTGEGTYDYAIELLRAPGGSEHLAFESLGILHDDRGAGEHGFAALVPRAGAGVQAFWLDGREMAAGGPMTLRTRTVGAAGGGSPFGPETALDARVCECCPTAGAPLFGAGGADEIVVYRDRGAGELRDVSAVRRRGDRFGAPSAVHEDGWRIDGCPVNGPALAARGEEVWVAWFTSAGERGRVLLARSLDGGGTFGAPLEVDDGEALGRTTLALDHRGRAWVAWVDRAAGEPGAAVRLLEVAATDAAIAGAASASAVNASSFVRGRAFEVARVPPARTTGIPRLGRFGRQVVVAWRDTAAQPPRLRAALVTADGD